MNILPWLALSIVVVLAVVAVYYSYLWHVRKGEIVAHNKNELELIAKKRLKAQESIDLIAKALLQGQVSSSEASIRIAHLSRALVLNENQTEVLSVFHKLAEECAHIPILDEWKKLGRKEKKQFDEVRFSLEEKYKDFTRSSAEKIIEEKFFQG